MNREAVALGVPVYTTFAGQLGAVDEALIADGRLRAAALRRLRSGSRSGPPIAAVTGRDPALLLDLMLVGARALAPMSRSG